ncbi:MAG TPA: YncE family protein [Fibrobacteria bacterium]|nr:YncE family protein [Fibrobacteria bacterium]
MKALFPVIAFVASLCVESRAAYSVTKTIALTGSGSFDFLTVEPAGRRLYIARTSEIVVVDIDNGSQTGSVTGMSDAHGVALAPEFNKGFASNGGTNKVSVFDLKTLAVTASVAAGTDPDHVLYDPFSKKVFVMNNGSGNITVIDAATNAVQATIQVGPTLELSVTDEAGRVFVGIAGTSNLGVINATTLKKDAEWSISPDGGSKTMGIDIPNHRLFNGGGSNIHAFDTQTGKAVGTTPNLSGSDGMEYDADRGVLFASGTKGALQITKWSVGDVFAPLVKLNTGGGKTIAFDKVTHAAFLVGANGSSVVVVSDPAAINVRLADRTRPLNRSPYVWTGFNVGFRPLGADPDSKVCYFPNGRQASIVGQVK